MKRTIIAAALGSIFWMSCDMGGTYEKEEKAAQVVLADTSHYTTMEWKDTVVNFKPIQMGEKATVVFKFKNTGKYPLFLTNVKAGCGCTVPGYTKGAIPPGGEGEVTGEFDSNKSHPGEVRKNIYVTTNTLGKSSHTLIFAGYVGNGK
ncbi:DUF1573 domain-containing protein [Sediminibacterium roseum]|uniref:DUF1573 domain-containing protein n=1 Tax=Sediminibacterium roseum TaxID=1978412 RepID=A0ABW9ZUM4_9BACT|nr:DUF1573 domain-containing protein [Sediminibacterium roseum]NCI50062.1 DUF1573 domain-containing protein [Sediminibacterium roseum]